MMLTPEPQTYTGAVIRLKLAPRLQTCTGAFIWKDRVPEPRTQTGVFIQIRSMLYHILERTYIYGNDNIANGI
jgi:hypothetical protein